MKHRLAVTLALILTLLGLGACQQNPGSSPGASPGGSASPGGGYNY